MPRSASSSTTTCNRRAERRSAFVLLIPCAGSGSVTHVASVLSFHSADEEYRGLLPFMKTGFECGGRAFHVVDSGLRNPVARVLLPAVVATWELGRHRG